MEAIDRYELDAKGRVLYEKTVLPAGRVPLGVPYPVGGSSACEGDAEAELPCAYFVEPVKAGKANKEHRQKLNDLCDRYDVALNAGDQEGVVAVFEELVGLAFRAYTPAQRETIVEGLTLSEFRDLRMAMMGIAVPMAARGKGHGGIKEVMKTDE